MEPDRSRSPEAGQDAAAAAGGRGAAAVIATLLLGPGAGHLARGRTGRGVAWFVAALLSVLPYFLGVWALALPVVIRLAAAVDAGLVRPPDRGLPRWGRVVLLWIALVIVSVGFSAVVRTFYVEAFKIPAASMFPTLIVGDHLMVDKLATRPARGDVIVFLYPGDDSKSFIKRVVAVGGDTVSFRGNQLVLNGKPVPRRRSPGPCSYSDDSEGSGRVAVRSCVVFEEVLDGKLYRVIQDTTGFSSQDVKPFKVPAGHVYVLGDNRDNSHDSRYWGTVPPDKIQGKAVYVWWSRAMQSRIGQRIH